MINCGVGFVKVIGFLLNSSVNRISRYGVRRFILFFGFVCMYIDYRRLLVFGFLEFFVFCLEGG